MKRLVRFLEILLIGVSVSFISMSGCENFMMSNEEFKQELEKEVIEANAEKRVVTVRAEDGNMGVTSPLGRVEVKIGIPFEITTTVNKEYAFVGWAQSGGNGNEIVFADAKKEATTATLKVPADGILIFPMFDRRPKQEAWFPYSGSKDNLINKSMSITFSEAIDPASVTLGEGKSIQITTIKTLALESPDPGNPVSPVHIESNFTPVVSEKTLAILLNDKTYHEIFSTITVTVSKDIRDTAGNSMADNFTWFFSTGDGKDEGAPTIKEVRIINSTNPDSKVTNSSTLGASVQNLVYGKDTAYKLKVTAEDEYSAVNRMRIVETPWDISAGKAVGTQSTVYDSDFKKEQDLSIKSAEYEGWKKIQVFVADTSNNWTPIDRTDNTFYLCYDKTSPAITTTGFASNSPNPAFATLNNTLALNFNLAEPNVQSSSITIAGKNLEGITSEGNYTKTTTVDGAVPEGLATYSVTVTDLAGNSSTVSNAGATDGLRIDKGAPVISNLSIASNNALNPSYATTGDSITFGFNVTEGNIASISTSIAGKAVPESGVPSAGTNARTYTVNAGDDTASAIAYSVTVTDKAGNSTTVDSGASGSVVIDTVAPTVTPPIVISDNAAYPDFVKTDHTVTLNFNAYDNSGGSGILDRTGTIVSQPVDSLITGSGTACSAVWKVKSGISDRPVDYSITVRDMAGNSTVVNATSTIAIDNSLPTINVQSIASTNMNPAYAKQGNTLTLGFNEVDGDIVTREVTIAGKAASATHGSASRMVTESETQGSIAYTVRVTDKAGNVKDYAGSLDTVKIDTIAPVISAVTAAPGNGNVGAWVNAGDTVTLTLTADEAGSGVNAGSAVIAGHTVPVTVGTAVGSGTTHTAVITVGASEAQQGDVNWSAVTLTDNAGNTSAAAVGSSVAAKIDTIAPAYGPNGVKLSPLGTPVDTWVNFGDTIRMTVDIGDPNGGSSGSGLASGSGIIAGHPVVINMATLYAEWPIAESETEQGSASWNGVTVTDVAGNVSAISSGSSPDVKIDTVKPVIDSVAAVPGNGNVGEWVNAGDTVTLTVAATESGSGVVSGSATIAGHAVAVAVGAGSTHTASITVGASEPEQGDVNWSAVTLTDKAGNTSAAVVGSSAAAKIDTVAPAFGTTPVAVAVKAGSTPVGEWVNVGDTLTMTLQATDAGAGTSGSDIASWNGTLGGKSVGASGALSADWPVAADASQGAVGWSGVRVYDLAGNVSVDQSGTETTVKIDTVAPVISAVTAAPSGGNVGVWVNAGDTVTLTLTADETGSGVNAGSATISGRSGIGVTIGTAVGAATTHTAAITINGSETPQGNVEWSAMTLTDLAGNVSAAAASSSAAAKIDTVVPTFSGTHTYVNPLLTLAVNADLSGFSRMEYKYNDGSGWDASWTEAAGFSHPTENVAGDVTYTFTGSANRLNLNTANEGYQYRVYDGAGNFSATKSCVYDSIVEPMAPYLVYTSYVKIIGMSPEMGYGEGVMKAGTPVSLISGPFELAMREYPPEVQNEPGVTPNGIVHLASGKAPEADGKIFGTQTIPGTRRSAFASPSSNGFSVRNAVARMNAARPMRNEVGTKMDASMFKKDSVSISVESTEESGENVVTNSSDATADSAVTKAAEIDLIGDKTPRKTGDVIMSETDAKIAAKSAVRPEAAEPKKDAKRLAFVMAPQSLDYIVKTAPVENPPTDEADGEPDAVGSSAMSAGSAPSATVTGGSPLSESGIILIVLIACASAFGIVLSTGSSQSRKKGE